MGKKMRDVSEELGGVPHMSVGGVSSILTTTPPPPPPHRQGGRNHSKPGTKTIRCINLKIMMKRKADGNENAKKKKLCYKGGGEVHRGGGG